MGTIHYRSERNGNAKYAADYDMSPEVAFGALVKYELGWNTTVVKVTSTHVTCHTQLLGHLDVVDFSGSEADMLPLVRAAGAYALIMDDSRDAVSEDVIEMLGKETEGNLSLAELGESCGMYRGHGPATDIALWAMDINPNTFPKTFKGNDILIALRIQIETGVPALEVLERTEPSKPKVRVSI